VTLSLRVCKYTDAQGNLSVTTQRLGPLVIQTSYPTYVPRCILSTIYLPTTSSSNPKQWPHCWMAGWGEPAQAHHVEVLQAGGRLLGAAVCHTLLLH
jgi:hypothetical protein